MRKIKVDICEEITVRTRKPNAFLSWSEKKLLYPL